MVIVKCDRCKKEIEDASRRYLYSEQYDLCYECQEVYDKIEKEISKMAIEMRRECENKIKEKANKMIQQCMMREVRNEKESI